MSINTGLPKENLAAISSALNKLLADEYVLYTKTNNYHWNVYGPLFPELHAAFESQYRTLADIVDEVAERVRALGAPSFGTLTEFLKHTRLTEKPGVVPKAHDMIKNLLDDHETVIRAIRQDMATIVTNHHDFGTENFLGGLLEKHEKIAWILRASVAENDQQA
jgi:starvation-inducible DNA-binding protein